MLTNSSVLYRCKQGLFPVGGEILFLSGRAVILKRVRPTKP